MNRIPGAPPLILPKTDDTPGPLWSVMIPAYNCSRFLPEAIRSVIANLDSIESMQVIVVDDASTDANVAQVVLEAGGGKVDYHRQPENVGSLRNFETCINLAEGKFIHILHGDDLVKPGYYKKMEELFRKFPEAGAAFCRYEYIDEAGKFRHIQPKERQGDGILKNWLLGISVRNTIQYAAITVKRSVYEELGSFYGMTYGEDWEMWARIAQKYPFAYTSEVLAVYRKHLDSITGKKFMTGEYLDDVVTAIKAIQDYLPAEKRSKILKKAKRNYARYGVNKAHEAWKISHNKSAARSSIRRILLLHQDLFVYYKIMTLQVKMKLKIYGGINGLFKR